MPPTFQASPTDALLDCATVGRKLVFHWFIADPPCEQNENILVFYMAYDVRAIANYVLRLAIQEGRGVSNLHINKIVYFLHADFLVAFSRPLVTAKIEAWTHGPVFRELYHEFKAFGNADIGHLATHMDPQSGRRVEARCTLIAEEEEFLKEQATRYISMSPGALVAQSHVPGGPWDQTWNHETQANASMKISDELIKSWYERTAKH